jgi:hypothetical protein
MIALQGRKRALLTLAVGAVACSTYEPDLLLASAGRSAEVAGQAGASGAGGAGAAAGTSAAAGSAMGGDELDAAAGMAVTPQGGGAAPMPSDPFVTVAFDDPSINVRLSQEGVLDWGHWGLQSASDFEHKAGVISQIWDFKPIGALGPVAYKGGPVTVTWLDGTPTATASTNDGIAWQGEGQGFELVVPAVVEARRLRLYLGVFGASGRMMTQLSDASGHSLSDDQLSRDTADWLLQVATIDYGNCEQPNTTLTVKWQVETAVTAGAAVSLTGLAIAPR